MVGPTEERNADRFFVEGEGNHVATVSSTGETSDTSARRTRGFSKNIELDRYVRIHGKITIEITDELRKLVCDNAVKFSGAIGKIVGESFSVRYATWKAVPKDARDHLKQCLLNHFIIDLSKKVVHEFIDHEMQTIFKEYQAELVKHYRKYSTLEEGRAHPHPRVVDIADWHILCNRWEDPKWKNMGEKNKQNRVKLPFNHYAGSKSFLHIQQKNKTREGENLGPIDLFHKTRYKEGKG